MADRLSARRLLGGFSMYSQLFSSCCFCCQRKLERVVVSVAVVAFGFVFAAVVFVMLSTFALFRFAIVQLKHFQVFIVNIQ